MQITMVLEHSVMRIEDLKIEYRILKIIQNEVDFFEVYLFCFLKMSFSNIRNLCTFGQVCGKRIG